jgi:hypothetical protein
MNQIMLGKFGIFLVILILVFLFYVAISLGAGQFSNKGKKPEVKNYLRSVNILLIFITVIGTILIFFL